MAGTEGGGQQRGSRQRDEADEVAVDAQDEVKERHEKLSDDVDSLLDEIDGVLEENAEEFVRGYIQKGGQ
jgi:ubiquitin-like protein Pup